MSFRTVIKPNISDVPIHLDNHVLSMGSCFSEHIGTHLKNSKFAITINPFGIIFNPISLFSLLDEEHKFADAHFIQDEGVWHHYDAHSQIWASEKEILAQKLEKTHQNLHNTLKQADYIFLTFGTALVYRLKQNGHIVANCHKMPHGLFQKELITLDYILKICNQFISKLRKEQHIILTVSPVRHLKETLPMNSVSKSVLRLAAHYLSQESDRVHYFPAYELLLDDLRDYRFYADDMLHPSKKGVQYIWNIFQSEFLTKEAQDFVKKWQKIKSALLHKPLHPNTKAHRKFLENLLQKLKNISEIDTSSEIHFVEQQLQSC